MEVNTYIQTIKLVKKLNSYFQKYEEEYLCRLKVNFHNDYFRIGRNIIESTDLYIIELNKNFTTLIEHQEFPLPLLI